MRLRIGALRALASAVAVAAAFALASPMPALATAGGGGSEGGGSGSASYHVQYFWHDGGTMENGTLNPEQGWDDASINWWQAYVEAYHGLPMDPTTGSGGGSVTHLAQFRNACSEALANARAREGDVQHKARVIAVGYNWVTASGHLRFTHWKGLNGRSTFKSMIPRQGNSRELPDYIGWNENNRNTGIPWRQYVYNIGAEDNTGNDYSVVALAVLDDWPEARGSITVTKESSVDWTDGMDAYTLANCRIGVYRDRSCSDLAYEMTTDKSGRAHLDDVPAGTYYLKEIEVPAGYLGYDGLIATITVEPGREATASFKEPVDSVTIDIEKDHDNADGVNGQQGDAELAGSEIQLTYDGNADGTPERTWMFASDESGDYNVDDGSGLARGDALFYDGSQQVVWPLGTYTVRETKAPEGCWLEGQTADSPANYQAPTHTLQATDDDLYLEIEDPIIEVPMTMQKVDEDSLTSMVGDENIWDDRLTPNGDGEFANTVFEIVNASDGFIVYEGDTYHVGDALGQFTSDADGRVDVTLPYGTYVIREVHSPEGYLLPEHSWLITVHDDDAVTMVEVPYDYMPDIPS